MNLFLGKVGEKGLPGVRGRKGEEGLRGEPGDNLVIHFGEGQNVNGLSLESKFKSLNSLII